jgi:hypothetical protein
MTDAEESYIYGSYTPDDTEQCATFRLVLQLLAPDQAQRKKVSSTLCSLTAALHHGQLRGRAPLAEE